MATNTQTTGQEGDVDAGLSKLSEREVSALTEVMTVMDEGGGIYSVTTQSGSEYAVDAETGRCTCPDWQYNLSADERCKHAHRVAFAINLRSIPQWVDEDAVDSGLGMHVDDV